MAKIPTAVEQAATTAPTATPWGTPPAAPIAAPAAPQAPAASVEQPHAVEQLGDGNGNIGLPSDNSQAKEGEIATAEQNLQEAKEDLAGMQAAHDNNARALQAAKDEVDKLTVALEKLQPELNSTNVIQAYHASQRKLMEERAQRLSALRSSGVDFKALLTIKAPIDQAMARKTGRGGQRPGKI